MRQDGEEEDAEEDEEEDEDSEQHRRWISCYRGGVGLQLGISSMYAEVTSTYQCCSYRSHWQILLRRWRKLLS